MKIAFATLQRTFLQNVPLQKENAEDSFAAYERRQGLRALDCAAF